ncbi:hypothetical protein ETAA8_28880 [Anatilimnocola aggregata]|uniref:Uncharacterized protein n=1 Tax=Anatilimnocola aggregata TaxID=2528021 RepID=A0A517YC22_9BACT|nr:hypothetical protein [Anatilimnocola aggregata]QDU27797.1 hypothetical protein ETAA8_28880 [Anatilimnocola aggregata]
MNESPPKPPAPRSTALAVNPTQQWIPWIMGGLLVWGAVLGLGAYLFGGEHAEIRGGIVFICALIFVSFWWMMLTARSWRKPKL